MPLYEHLFLWSRWVLLGVLALGAVFSAINNALSLVTPAFSYVGSAALLLLWLVLVAVARLRGIAWTETQGIRVRLRRLSAKTHFFFVGCLLLLWVPRVADQVRAASNPTLNAGREQHGGATSGPSQTTSKESQASPVEQSPPPATQPPVTVQPPVTTQPPVTRKWWDTVSKGNFTFTPLDPIPNARITNPVGINEYGDVVGTYALTLQDSLTNFVYFAAEAKLIRIDDPPNAQVSGINKSRAIVGSHPLAETGRHGRFHSGFVRHVNGRIDSFTCLDSSYTYATAMNDEGQIAGNTTDAYGARHGFLRETDGTCTKVEYPGASATFPTGINNKGDIIGIWEDSKSGGGFLRGKDGAFRSLRPDSTTNFQPRAINDDGIIVGDAGDGTGGAAVLRRANGTFVLLEHPRCSSSCTRLRGINRSGQVLGEFSAGGNTYAFRADPARQ